MTITDKEREQGIYKVTIAGSITNFLLIVFKFVTGFIGRSSAMIADAVHSLSDFITDVIVIVLVRISNKPKDKCHDYGHGKYETFASLLIGFILLLVGLGVALKSLTVVINVFFKGAALESPGMLALAAAIVSIVCKEALYQYTAICGRKLKSDAVLANAWHHRSDAFSSIATTVGIGGAIFLGEKWTILDPLAALFVSFFIAKVAVKLMKPSMDELMEKSLPDDVENEITAIVESFAEVHNLHNLRTRKLGNQYAIEFHIRMDGIISLAQAHDKVTAIEQSLIQRFGEGTHVIIHTEPMK